MGSHTKLETRNHLLFVALRVNVRPGELAERTGMEPKRKFEGYQVAKPVLEPGHVTTLVDPGGVVPGLGVIRDWSDLSFDETSTESGRKRSRNNLEPACFDERKSESD